jgi:hypothetical protein
MYWVVEYLVVNDNEDDATQPARQHDDKAETMSSFEMVQPLRLVPSSALIKAA